MLRACVQEGEGKRAANTQTPKKGTGESQELESSSWLPKLLPAVVLLVAVWWKFYGQQQ